MSSVTWWALLLIVLAAHRSYRIIGKDTITEPLRVRLTGLSDGEYSTWDEWITAARMAGRDPWQLHQEQEAREDADLEAIPGRAQWYRAELARCPWCAGWWVSLTWACAWLAWPTVMWKAALPFAVSTLVGWAATRIDVS